MIKKLLFLFLILTSFSANAEEILNTYKKEISEIENYLNTIQYFSSNFIQDNNTFHELSEGKFYLSRPGKLRLEYTLPNKILLITNGKGTTYYDVELEEVSKIPTKKTPIYFLVKDVFNFKNNDLKVINFRQNKKTSEIFLIEKNKEEQGTLSLVFQKNPMQLIGLKLINDLGQKIEIEFNHIVVNSKINPQLFVFKNPKSISERKDRY